VQLISPIRVDARVDFKVHRATFLLLSNFDSLIIIPFELLMSSLNKLQASKWQQKVSEREPAVYFVKVLGTSSTGELEPEVLGRYHVTSYGPTHDVIASQQSTPGAGGGKQCLRIIWKPQL